LDVAIVDPLSGGRLAAGSIGEIAVRSAMSIGSYWGQEKATAAAYFEHDWFRPRDFGYLDGDGFLYYADRVGDEIRVGDTVVYPHHVEAEIMRQPPVKNCGVVGLGSDGSVEVVAAVQLEDPTSASRELEAEILARCSISTQRPPDRVVFIDELPTVLGGVKVRRAALREQLLAR
jgi:fatty-acyl-CoA synthase